MPSVLKWEAASTANTLVSSGAVVANDSISGPSTAYDNSVNLNTYGWLEFVGTFGATPDASNPTLDIYMAQAPDGTNYQDAPLTGGANQTEMYVISIPVQKNTASQRITVGPIPLPPHKFQLYLDNQAGASASTINLNSGWTLKLYTNNLEGQ